MTSPPRWMHHVLVAAGLYNLVWGAAVVFFPDLFFQLADLDPPRYPAIWQCVGMIVGVYGVGYLIAARDHRRHWPIVLVGLLGKIFGPIGFIHAVLQGTFPISLGWTLLTNDLVWWIPFAMILWDAARAEQKGQDPTPDARDFSTLLADARSHDGRSLLTLSEGPGALVVFLRHAGCTFCREAMEEIGRRRAEIESTGRRIVLVHMGADASLALLASRYGLADVPRISDPDRALYRRFGLERGRFLQLFGPSVVWRGIAATLRGHRIGRLEGDGFQMPGVFVLRNGSITQSYRHRTAADRPDYCRIA